MKGSVFIATSLDGFIARRNGDIDWLPTEDGSDGDDHGYHDFMKTVDVVIMGRGTYEKVLTFGAWPFTKPVVVLSSRPLELPSGTPSTVEALSGDPTEVAERLTSRGVKHAYIDGGVTIQRFLSAGLIQRLILTRIPVLIGEGIPLFGTISRDIRLEHVQTKSYANGLVQSEYAVKPPPL